MLLSILVATLTASLLWAPLHTTPSGSSPPHRADLPQVEEVLLDEIGTQQLVVEDLVLAFAGVAESVGLRPSDAEFQQVQQQYDTVRLLYGGIVHAIALQVVEGHDVKYLQYVEDLDAARAEVEELETLIPGENFAGMLEKAARLASVVLGEVVEVLDSISERATRVEGRVEAPEDVLNLTHRLEMAQSIRDAFVFQSFDDLVARAAPESDFE